MGIRVSVSVLPTPTGFGTPVCVDANVRSAPAKTAVVTVAVLFVLLGSCSFAAMVTALVMFPPAPFVVLTTSVRVGKDPTAVDPEREQVTVPDAFAQLHPVPAAET